VSGAEPLRTVPVTDRSGRGELLPGRGLEHARKVIGTVIVAAMVAYRAVPKRSATMAGLGAMTWRRHDCGTRTIGADCTAHDRW
jgi:hypothetical protein